ncbi:7-dehydrocholesterol reductase [Morella rubra]|uniref:7-dehydrocholesterol reductase n=1 Tax=Morella rubra TaxID=262757 RepID=A0A6A1VJU4_9ROSI|nr:7-dehydrocholesterol reductase [Morella rubra]
MYLVNHPVNLGTQLALYILVAGIFCIYINYDCDRQRQEFRRTNGKCLVWGKAPSKIVASYTTTSGETKTSLLLTSGCPVEVALLIDEFIFGGMLNVDRAKYSICVALSYNFSYEGVKAELWPFYGSCRWGLARHFHYVPEILAAFFWTVPALFNHFLPYFYVIFLTILLFDRAKRDDDRCRSKYGKYWKVYCDKVPNRIIPGIY